MTMITARRHRTGNGEQATAGRWMRVADGERGSVTAETAMVIPLLAACTLALCWLLSLGIAQVRLVDASRDAARALARGDDPADVRAHVGRAAPGSRVDTQSDGGLVIVKVTDDVPAPDWLLVPLPNVTLRAQSAVVDEGSDAPS